MKHLPCFRFFLLLGVCALFLTSCMSGDSFGNFGRGVLYALAIGLSCVVYAILDKKDVKDGISLLCAAGTFLFFAFIAANLTDDGAKTLGIIIFILIIVLLTIYLIQRFKNNE